MTTPSIPYTLTGIIRDVTNAVLENADVQIYLLRTGEAISGTTNSAGEYIIDLANMEEEYTANDEIQITAYKKAGDIIRFQQIRRTIDVNSGYTEQNMTLVAQNPHQPEAIGPISSVFREHDPVAQARRSILVGYTEAGEILPLKVTKDSSGFYGLLNVTP